MGAGQGAGLSNIVQGEQGGNETVTLTVNNLPSHGHTANTVATSATTTVNVVNTTGNSASPAANTLAVSTARDNLFSSSAPSATMAGGTIKATATANTNVEGASTGGNSVPFGIRSPFLGVTYCIAIIGVFPSRP